MITIVGGGLAGSECAWQLASRGIDVTLVEQKPLARTPAQSMDGLCELVCSNSFRGEALSNAVGLIKEEMRRAGSLVMAAALEARVPAGGALAVDREVLSRVVTARLESHPRIARVAEIVTKVPEARPVVIATGPLTGDALAADIARTIGSEHLAYYDAIAPVVEADSIDWDRVFLASRYDKGGGDDYVNCPLDEAGYRAFVDEVVRAEKVVPHEFEDVRYFEGCLPLEVMAERGEMTLAFGPMKPVGLVDPKTGKRPFAVVQLRAEDKAKSAYNLVGFQTRMKWPEQKRVFRMIPGLENAEFVRLGSVHRNTFVRAPEALDDALALRNAPGVHLAGQITGVEGYVESAASGLVLGTMLAMRARGEAMEPPPPTTALGALYRYTRTPRADYQPSNVVFSMFPELEGGRPKVRGKRADKKRAKHEAMAERALGDLAPWLARVGAEELVGALALAPSAAAVAEATP